jgi:hypothetical protein
VESVTHNLRLFPGGYFPALFIETSNATKRYSVYEKSSYVRIFPREMSIVFSGMGICEILSLIVLTALKFRKRKKEITFIVKE